jgi:hypothetical protein
MSDIAGKSIVSPYIVMSIEDPRIAKDFHPEEEILLFPLSFKAGDSVGSNEDDLSKFSFLSLPACFSLSPDILFTFT